MLLKSIEMHGFKSFAEKTVIEFGRGITAIVGPNGSGKSNISDAIRWVMGEQSAKTLRGGSMQDVIFSGTQKRKSQGFAEVSLNIDNSDKTLAIDYEDVSITRRVYRSGESEYFINKASCRLKDIHELFMDTGVGRDGYSIIGQGKIAEIISSKPEDRRHMFEEAAGITKYRYSKEESERKLAHTTENVMRVTDIINELEVQIEPLREKSEKAKKYLVLRDELRELEVSVSLINIEKIKKNLAETEQIFKTAEEEIENLKAEIEKSEAEISASFEKMRETEESAEEKRSVLEKNTLDISAHKSDIEVLKNQMLHNKENIERLRGEMNELEQRMSLVKDEAKQCEAQLASANATKTALSAEIAEKEAEAQQIDRTILSNSKSSEETSAEILRKINRASELRANTENINVLQDSYRGRIKEITDSIEEKSGYFATLEKNVAELEANFSKLEKEKNDLKEKENNLRNKNDEFDKKLFNLRAEKEKAERTLANAISRQKLLTDMENSFDSYGKGVKSVMQAEKEGKLGVVKLFGMTAQLAKVPKEYETAIEIALGAASQNIVVETEQDAKRAIEYLKRNKAGRATFLPVSSVKGMPFAEENQLKGTLGFVGVASKLISFDNKFQNVFASLLGRVAVFDNIDNAISASKKFNYKIRIVTLEGELLAPGGSISGGTKGNSLGLFARANELSELNRNMKNYEDGVKVASDALDKLLSDKEKLQSEIREYAEKVTNAEKECVKAEADITHAKVLLDNMNQAKRDLEREADNLKSEITALESNKAELKAEIEKEEKETENLKRYAESQQGSSQQLIKTKEEIASALIELRMKHSAISKDCEIYTERASATELRMRELEHQIQQKSINVEEITENNENIDDDIIFKQNQIKEISEECEQLKAEIASGAEQRRETEETLKKMQKEIGEKRERQSHLQEDRARIEGKKAKAESELELIVNRLWEEYNLTLSSAEQYKQEIESPAQAQRRVNTIRGEIKNLGSVDVDAINEYKNIKERFDFLTTQRDDLIKAQKNLEDVIADMVKIMREQFASKFEIISGYFNDVFVALFGGGKARLTLTDKDNLLSSGVEIDVQPPGKALKNIIQLSGGEQAMVSIALLFAILKVRPAPFCILDEIEAPLDDVNVYRFADYVKSFTDKSQFIIVTHKRGTMEAANILYGVTMQEKGVSNIISLNMDDVQLSTDDVIIK